jgi:hypothetical protein
MYTLHFYNLSFVDIMLIKIHNILLRYLNNIFGTAFLHGSGCSRILTRTKINMALSLFAVTERPGLETVALLENFHVP